MVPKSLTPLRSPCSSLPSFPYPKNPNFFSLPNNTSSSSSLLLLAAGSQMPWGSCATQIKTESERAVGQREENKKASQRGKKRCTEKQRIEQEAQTGKDMQVWRFVDSRENSGRQNTGCPKPWAPLLHPCHSLPAVGLCMRDGSGVWGYFLRSSPPGGLNSYEENPVPS